MMRGMVLIFLFGLFIAACSGASPQVQATDSFQDPTIRDPTPIPIDPNTSSTVVLGHLAPAASIDLSFSMKGQVAEVLVQEGTTVKAGDILARLASQEALEARVSDAKLDLLFARQNYDDLHAGLPEAQTTALEELYVAQETLRQVEARVGVLSNPAPPSASQIEIARANVAIAKKSLDKASNEYRPFANKPEDNLTRATLLQKLASAQDRYNRAVGRLNSLLGGSVQETGIDQAETELAIAQARLAMAQTNYELLLQGPDPKELETTNARIETAEKTLAAAEAALKGLELVAPMDGTVVNLDLISGQNVAEGQVVLMVVDFSQWYIETDTLSENQVVEISPGQLVSIVPESLQTLRMDGVVEFISRVYREQGGKVTYTARIRVDEVDPRLRWGMRMVASFDNPLAQK